MVMEMGTKMDVGVGVGVDEMGDVEMGDDEMGNVDKMDVNW
jgi:hypothetical protein